MIAVLTRENRGNVRHPDEKTQMKPEEAHEDGGRGWTDAATARAASQKLGRGRWAFLEPLCEGGPADPRVRASGLQDCGRINPCPLL